MYVGTHFTLADPAICEVSSIGVLGTCVVVKVGVDSLGLAAIGGMDFDHEGTLYAALNIAGGGGTGSDHLATIDPVTGAASIVGPFGSCVGVPPVPSDGRWILLDRGHGGDRLRL